MQIHELNNYNGDLDSKSYLAIDNGTDTGKISKTGLFSDIEQKLTDTENQLNGRIDNIIAGGAAPSASEIVDARRGADGVDYASLGEAIRSQVTTLQEEIDSVDGELWTNLFIGQSLQRSWYVDPSTGVGRALAQFKSFVNVPIPGDTIVLFPYSDNGNGTYYIRAISFYDIDGNFISGISGTADGVANGIFVPDGAATLSASLTLAAENYYLSLIKNNGVKINEDSLNLSPEPVQKIRKPTFSFIFDDGTAGDVNAKALFDSFGFKCGFALLALDQRDRYRIYIGYQQEGFEILSHSVNGTAFSDVTDLATAEEYLRDSINVLTSMGLNVTGWVTPSTWMNADQFPIMCKYYQYGFGHLRGTDVIYTNTFKGKDIRQIDRWSLQSNTIEATMSQIQNCIDNNGFMCFYGHSYPSSDNMTAANMQTILSFLKEKSDDGEIIVDIPRKAINDYYAFRHSDYLDLING